MSEDQEDPAKGHFVQFYVPRSTYDADHRNVEVRITDLRKDMDGARTRLESIDRLVNTSIARHDKVERRLNVLESSHNDTITEQNVSRKERVAILALLQDLGKTVHETSADVGQMRHMQVFGWMIVLVLIVTVLLKVW